jgi:hypothetical protein
MNCANHSDQAAVAFCRTCGKPLCNQCTRDVRGVIYCEACLAARMETPAPPPASGPVAGFAPVQQAPYTAPYAAAPPPQPTSGPNPAVAGILAGFFPFGVGAVYCSQFAKGLAHLVIMVLLIAGQSMDVPWYVHMMLGFGIAFFYVYQIIDAVRSAKAIQMGEPVPDPLGLAQTFGGGGGTVGGGVADKTDAAKIPTGAVLLIGLGVLFLLHTAGFFEFGLERFWPLILIFLGAWLFAKQWGFLGGRTGACQCDRCRTRRIMGPAILTTVGVLFLLDSMSRMDFGRTWPAILLVVGVVKLIQSNASWEGHVGPLPRKAQGFPPNPPTPPGAPPSAPQPPASGEVKNV